MSYYMPVGAETPSTTQSLITGASNVISSIFGKPPQTIVNAAPKNGLPAWVMPAAIGGGLLVGVVLWKRSRGKGKK